MAPAAADFAAYLSTGPSGNGWGRGGTSSSTPSAAAAGFAASAAPPSSDQEDAGSVAASDQRLGTVKSAFSLITYFSHVARSWKSMLLLQVPPI